MIPPERARGEPPTALTDQWSLGLVALLLAPGAAEPPPTPDPADLAARADVLERDWPALGRLVRRMCDPQPANRFPSIHPVRQELLALARRTGGASDRRALAQRLTRERGAPAAHEDPPSDLEVPVPVAAAVPVPAPAPAAAPVVEAAPPPPSTLSATPSSTDPTPRLAPRRPAPLPSEQIPVVRPDLSGEIPLASLGRPEVPEVPEVREVPETPEALPPAAVRELAAVWREAPDPGLVTAPTVVPLTDSGDPTDPGPPDPPMPPDPKPSLPPDPPSVSEAWFDPTTEPEPDPSLGLSGISPVLPSSEPALPPEDDDGPARPAPAAEAPPFPIQRVAPVLALVLAGLVGLWLLTRLW